MDDFPHDGRVQYSLPEPFDQTAEGIEVHYRMDGLMNVVIYGLDLDSPDTALLSARSLCSVAWLNRLAISRSN